MLENPLLSAGVTHRDLVLVPL